MFFFNPIFCVIVIAANRNNTYNDRNIIANEIVWIRQFFFLVFFLSSSKVSGVFNISSLHSKTSLPIWRSSHEQFLLSKYLSTVHALLHSQSLVLGFHIYSFSQELQLSHFLQSHQYPLWFNFCFELHTLSFDPHLHSQDSCWTKNLVLFTLDIKLNTFTFIFLNFIWNTNLGHCQQCNSFQHTY